MQIYTIYKITNNLNNKYYIGKHQTVNLNDSYMGSGKLIKRAIEKYGIENFTKEILHIFTTAEEMDAKEKELVTLHENSYNMTEGGKGGFSFIQKNNLNKGSNNVMHDIVVKTKNLETRRENILNNPDLKRHLLENSLNNLKKAVESNKGRKRPEHSKIMREKSSFLKMWSPENKEKSRDLFSSNFQVISPSGEIYCTNRLESFCKEHKLTYVSVWNTSRTNKPVSKGKSKGWICKIIEIGRAHV